MKTRASWGVATAIGLAVAVALMGSGQAKGQIGLFSPFGDIEDGNVWRANRPNAERQAAMERQGTWAEVINASPRWLVIQDQSGRQYPIAGDRIRQFLVRWPSGANQLSADSMVEVTGPDAGSGVIIADHIDHYEADAQNLVSPTSVSLYGNDLQLNAFDLAQQNTFGAVYWLTQQEYSLPNKIHAVGRALGTNPVRVNGFNGGFYTIQPSANGMTINQVTLGTLAYAKRGDLVYFTPEAATPRSLDIAQLVLYKKIPLRMFQP